MQMHSTLLVSTAILAAASAVPMYPSDLSPTVHTVFKLNNATFLENLAVRPNGSLVVTTIQYPWVYTIDPTAHKPEPSILAVFEDGVANGISGIAEIAPDRFAIIAANWNLTDDTAKNTSIWTFDAGARPLRPRKVAVLPDNAVGNGATNLATLPGNILIADPFLGGVWRVDLNTGKSRLVIQDPTMANNPNVTGGFPIGINGLHIRDSYLYYTNSKLDAFFRMPIRADGTRAGPAEKIVGQTTGTTSYDDFMFDKMGNAYITATPSDLVKVTPDGKSKVFINGGTNSTLFGEQPTSAAFGRGSLAQEQTLYVTTAKGTVFAVDLSKAIERHTY